jgi:hypothetical protein
VLRGGVSVAHSCTRITVSCCAVAQTWDLGTEPMFVGLDAEMRYTTTEIRAEDAGRVYSELGAEMGVMPGSCGINSGRRNGAVSLSQGLDSNGMGQMGVKKFMQHRSAQVRAPCNQGAIRARRWATEANVC